VKGDSLGIREISLCGGYFRKILNKHPYVDAGGPADVSNNRMSCLVIHLPVPAIEVRVRKLIKEHAMYAGFRVFEATDHV
jgi:hypothetical protein